MASIAQHLPVHLAIEPPQVTFGGGASFKAETRKNPAPERRNPGRAPRFKAHRAVQMPDLPGDLVCRALRAREDTKDLPVVIVTGGSADDYARAVRAGASDVLSKPLSRRTLLEAVGRFLRPKALTRSLTRVPGTVKGNFQRRFV